MPYKNPEDRRKNNLRYRAKHREGLAAYDRKRYKKRRESPDYLTEVSKYHAAWYLENRARISENQKLWAASNRDKTREATRRWERKNPGAKRKYKQTVRGKQIGRINAHKRRARLSGNGGKFSLEQWLSRFEFYGKCCAYCGIELDSLSVQIDHVIPISRGGPDWPSNLVPSCSLCNLRKGTRLVLPFWLRHGDEGVVSL